VLPLGGEAEPYEARQHLAGDLRGARLEALEHDLGQHHGREVLAGALVDDAELVARADDAGQLFQRDVGAGRSVVELAVVVPLIRRSSPFGSIVATPGR